MKPPKLVFVLVCLCVNVAMAMVLYQLIKEEFKDQHDVVVKNYPIELKFLILRIFQQFTEILPLRPFNILTDLLVVP